MTPKNYEHLLCHIYNKTPTFIKLVYPFILLIFFTLSEVILIVKTQHNSNLVSDEKSPSLIMKKIAKNILPGYVITLCSL